MPNKKGFTIIEVIIAVFVITVGVGAAVILISQTIGLVNTTSSKLIASYLAQEGIEIVRNIRDGNFLILASEPATIWTDNILDVGCPSNVYEADYLSQTLSCISGTGQKLKVDSNYYNYLSGSETNFIRKIIINPDVDKIDVLVEVSWQDKGSINKVTAQANLYDWWE
ncbi:MAG: prepilin-type N-terminal cleavage/methylation domain-containing protein [Candidatus Nealsonbacteria bacterium]